VIVAVLSEAGSNGGALFLNDGSLVSNGLGRSHVADELLYYSECESVTLMWTMLYIT
jgi:hypothetical protein